MNCKNCESLLIKDATFCSNCGGKIVKERITFKKLLSEVFNVVFGWDSKFFLTLKKMLISPHIVLKDYIDGVRKRYVNPFAYLAIGAALSLLIFNFFSEDFTKVMSSANTEQLAEVEAMANRDLTKIEGISTEELNRMKTEQLGAKMNLKFLDWYYHFFMKYFNIITFLFLPVYALMSKFTYRKPHNFGEHIVFNAYLQGTTMYVSILFFLLSLVTNPKLYIYGMFMYMIYYLYTFSKLYKHSIKKSILKFLRFLIVLLILLIILFIIGFVLAILVGMLVGYFNPALLESFKDIK